VINVPGKLWKESTATDSDSILTFARGTEEIISVRGSIPCAQYVFRIVYVRDIQSVFHGTVVFGGRPSRVSARTLHS